MNLCSESSDPGLSDRMVYEQPPYVLKLSTTHDLEPSRCSVGDEVLDYSKLQVNAIGDGQVEKAYEILYPYHEPKCDEQLNGNQISKEDEL